MFRWASPQPMSSALQAWLRQAGGFHCPWVTGSDPGDAVDLVVFEPPHALLACEAAAGGAQGAAGLGAGLGAAYHALASADPRLRLVNGERLIALEAAEISHWLMGHPLARPLELPSVEPLLAAVTLALLQVAPGLELAYERLDARSHRGGAAPDAAYSRRLQPTAEALVEAWSQRPWLPADPAAGQRDRQLRQALEDELEHAVLACHAARERAQRQSQLSEALQAELRRSILLGRRLIDLQGRLF